jgi:hypothetical protein
VSWLQLYLKQDPSWNWQTLRYAEFDQLFAQSVSEFSSTGHGSTDDARNFVCARQD